MLNIPAVTVLNSILTVDGHRLQRGQMKILRLVGSFGQRDSGVDFSEEVWLHCTQ